MYKIMGDIIANVHCKKATKKIINRYLFSLKYILYINMCVCVCVCIYLYTFKHYCLKMRGCFNPTLGQIWTKPNVGLKIKKCNPMAGFVHI